MRRALFTLIFVAAAACSSAASPLEVGGAGAGSPDAGSKVRVHVGALDASAPDAGHPQALDAGPPPPPAKPDSGPPRCGNGVKDGEEECDGSDFGGESCRSLIGLPGTLLCDPETCTFHTGLCGMGATSAGGTTG